ncbi:protein of unknown function [Thauera humireducens]|nr:protein of unknown function [Thauera humireducens]
MPAPLKSNVDWQLPSKLNGSIGSSRDGRRWFAMVRGRADVSVRPFAASMVVAESSFERPVSSGTSHRAS